MFERSPDRTFVDKGCQFFCELRLPARRPRPGFANELCLDRPNGEPGVFHGNYRWNESIELRRHETSFGLKKLCMSGVYRRNNTTPERGVGFALNRRYESHIAEVAECPA